MSRAPNKPKFPPPLPNPAGHGGRRNLRKIETQHPPVDESEEELTDPGLGNPIPAMAIPTLDPPTASLEVPPLGEEEFQDLKPELPPTPVVPIKMPDLGPLKPLMESSEITEIMVNDLRNVMVEKNGKIMVSGLKFSGIDDLHRIIRNITDFTGRIVSPDSPYLDVMLPDGSRVNIVTPPLTVNAPSITIRKFPRRFSMETLLQQGAMSKKMAYFLAGCVKGRINILVSGGTGSGKTTLLNALGAFIPKSQRTVTIEDTPELVLPHDNGVKLQTKPQSPASPAIGTRELVANSLRMRPDRVIVGECRGPEALDMLQAMNTGHDGSMTTVHANSPRDGLSRLETLCMMGGYELPLTAIRKQIASAIDLIVQVKRFRNGQRKIVSIQEVTGMEGEIITLQNLFEYETDKNENGRFKPCGMIPLFCDRLKGEGVEFAPTLFTVDG